MSEKDENLTPWQLENEKYHEERGEVPHWRQELEESEDVGQPEEIVDEEGDPILKRRGKRKEQPEVAPVIEEVEEMQEVPIPEIEYESFQDVLPKLKQQKNRKLRRRMFTIVGTFFLLIMGALYVISPLSKVGTIRVFGVGDATRESVLKAAGIPKGEWLYNAYLQRNVTIDKIIHSNQRFKQAMFQLKGIHDIEITIVQYQTAAYEQEGEEFVPVLENGVAVNEGKTKTPPDTFLKMLDFKGKRTQIANMVKVYQALTEEQKSWIKDIKLTPTKSNPDLITIELNDGNQIRISIEDVVRRIKYYPQVAKNMTEPGVVDMEVAIFSYPYSKVEEEQKEKTENAPPETEKEPETEENT